MLTITKLMINFGVETMTIIRDRDRKDVVMLRNKKEWGWMRIIEILKREEKASKMEEKVGWELLNKLLGRR